MMTISEPRLRSLLRQAERVANAGKRSAAAQLYRQIIDEAPDSPDAWFGLSGVVDDPAESRTALKRVLTLDPDHAKAAAELARIEGDGKGDAHQSAAVEPRRDVDPYSSSRAWLDEVTASKNTTVAPPSPVVDSDVNRETVRQADDPRDGQPVRENVYELTCYRHPDRNTALRCYTCDRPICSECAVKTPVGYRCPTCIREAEEIFFDAKAIDYVLAPLAALLPSLLAGFLTLQLGGGFFFIFIVMFAGGAAGGLIARIAKRVVNRRRGRYLPHVVAATVALGAIIPALPILLLLLAGNGRALTALLIPGIYLFVAASAAFYQMK